MPVTYAKYSINIYIYMCFLFIVIYDLSNAPHPHSPLAMSDASKSISTEISSSFDESWNRRAEMDDHIKHNALLWGDYLMQLNNDVLSMSSEYNNVFQPMKVTT